MGHDVHFLRRIERLSPVQADLALALYREPDLVKRVLGRVRLPDGAERVALALEDAPESPHVIVTRAGRFVTCLGAGMTVSGCPVVSRPQIDHASERIAAMRTTLASGHSDFRRMFRNLAERGGGLPREDFMALAALAPIMGREYVGMCSDLVRLLVRIHDRYYPGRYRKITPELRDELQVYWAATWCLGHLAAIFGERADDIQAISSGGEKMFVHAVQASLMAAVCSQGAPVMMRTVWATARAGRLLLPWARQRVQETTASGELLATGLALSAIGLRHRRTLAEVTKTLARRRRELDVPELLTPERDAMAGIVEMLEAHLDPAQQELSRRPHRDTGARAYVRYTAHLPEGAPLRFTREEDVPDELAMPMLMHLHDDIYVGPHGVPLLVMMLPWLATSDGPSLYLPAQLLDQCRSLFEPEEVAKRIGRLCTMDRIERPVRAEARPGRNEPCSCGSGKKYKRCCGANA
jgi:hypothetical protein